MLVRSKAPLRLGLAGGGTDVSPYSDMYGGAVLNATIDLYAVSSLEPLDNGKIEFISENSGKKAVYESKRQLVIEEGFELFAGVYNRIVRQFSLQPMSFRLSSFIEAPQGSGLGTSSTIVVSLVGAFVEWLKLPLGKYDIAHLAYEIERIDLKMAGGKQDQYAATFGGINFLEFSGNDQVIVNPLQLKSSIRNELELNLLLYYTSTQRLSAQIIAEQVRNVRDNVAPSVEAMHKLKEQSKQMKEALLKGELAHIGEILHFGWTHKKAMAASISNEQIEKIYQTAIEAGSTGGKISGAGGGGYMFFYCPGVTKTKVASAIRTLGGNVQPFKFTQSGLEMWSIKA